MPREKECYRSVLERIDEVFPNKSILTVTDVAKYTGRSRVWATKFVHNNISDKDFKMLGGIGKEKLASLLS